MRRRSRTVCLLFAALIAGTLTVSPAVAASSPAASSPAAAAGQSAAPATGAIPPGTTPDDQPPAGATDGIPVGEPRVSSGRTPNAQVLPAAVTPDKTHRYFGDGPWNAIKSAADNQSVCTGLSHAQLQAMVLTTIFRESAGATSAGSEPAPMTLSRYDEWTGVRAGNTNVNANYGLYAFRDPSTSYKRVFWHPGIGIWQYDSAGVGAPYTAAERISTSFLAPKVAAEMRGSYCSSTRSTPEGKRYDAWAPWSLSCQQGSTANATYCEEIFQGLIQTNFSIVTRTAGFSATGGAVAHTCALTSGGNYPCWLIDPTKAQGATWWATLKPLDGGAPNRTSSPATPISTPFYVIKRNGLEQRYWLAADSGYSRDVTGTRVLGKNARPKDKQSGSGVTWSYGTGLCDRTLRRGACDPNIPPNLVTSGAVDAAGPFNVVMLDADGSGLDDIFYYRPAPAASWIWLNRGGNAFTAVKVPLGGSYEPIPGDFTGDGRDDLYLYNKSSGLSYLLPSNGNGTFGSIRIQAPAGLTVKALNRNGNSTQDLLMYAPGSAADAFWEWNGKSFTATPLVVGGTFQVLIGDFDGNGLDDVVFYAPGPAIDYLRLHGRNDGVVSRRLTLNGNYRAAVGDFDGNNADDLLWYGPGSGADSVWFGGYQARFASQRIYVGGDFQPVIADLPKDGRKDVFWYAPGSPSDYWSRWSSTRMHTMKSATLKGLQQPHVGHLSTGGGDGIFWYGVGSMEDWIWWQ